MSHWSEPRVSFCERWWGLLASWGSSSSCMAAVWGQAHAPQRLLCRAMQAQLCFLCLLTSSPVIKSPTRIVLTIWAGMCETKESGADFRICKVQIPAGWERRQVGADFSAVFDSRLRLLSRSVISWLEASLTVLVQPCLLTQLVPPWPCPGWGETPLCCSHAPSRTSGSLLPAARRPAPPAFRVLFSASLQLCCLLSAFWVTCWSIYEAPCSLVSTYLGSLPAE